MFSDKDKLFDLYYEGNWDLTATRASFKYKVIGIITIYFGIYSLKNICNL